MASEALCLHRQSWLLFPICIPLFPDEMVGCVKSFANLQDQARIRAKKSSPERDLTGKGTLAGVTVALGSAEVPVTGKEMLDGNQE